jgi:hypothetical protein
MILAVCLCNAGVFTSSYVPMEGQFFENIQRSMFGMCGMSGTIAHVLSNLLVSTTVSIPIHNRRTDWSSTCKLSNRHCITRHLLSSSPLPLCPINRSSIRNRSRIYSMISTMYWAYYKSKDIKGPICRNIHRSKYSVPPTTRPRISWHTWKTCTCVV